jgi:amphi-Trp domain-containing protein
MAHEDDEFRFESMQDTGSIEKYLNALMDGFANGKIILGNQDQRMILEPDGLIKLEVKAKQKRDRVKLSLICSWKERKDERPPKEELIIETE